MKKEFYCSYCGSKMMRLTVEAHTVEVYEPYGSSTYSLASKYNKDTGKIQYSFDYKCPNYKDKRWFHFCSPHDFYNLEEVFTK